MGSISFQEGVVAFDDTSPVLAEPAVSFRRMAGSDQVGPTRSGSGRSFSRVDSRAP